MYKSDQGFHMLYLYLYLYYEISNINRCFWLFNLAVNQYNVCCHKIKTNVNSCLTGTEEAGAEGCWSQLLCHVQQWLVDQELLRGRHPTSA